MDKFEKEYQKVKDVYASCITSEQLKTADAYGNLFIKKYKYLPAVSANLFRLYREHSIRLLSKEESS